jgi:alginate O-acetyltransferase complex protein AlgI
MVFSSHLFVFYFLPLALLAYYAAPRRGRHLVLTLASYLFYGWANPAFTLLMLVSTAVDYFCGLALAGRLQMPWRRSAAPAGPIAPLPPGGPRSRGQKAAVVVSVVANLSLLGFFKYFNFGVDSYNGLVALLGLPALAVDSALRVVLPLGISFYTFQSMSYTLDVYRGTSAALAGFVDFACYVSMFPQLVAGPIVRFSEVDDQLRSRRHTREKFARGVAFFALGMAKKVLVANPCGQVADAAFGAGALRLPEAWTGVVAYAFQIYFDFSGYSDMAIGLGLMLGFVFPKNFDSPYRAESITDFWRRWHISLSTWLRDYLYLPLGGNRKGRARTYVNLAIVMLLGGLWHGAAWTFVVWGGLHGALLAIERARGKRALWAALPRAGRVTATFLTLLVTWVFFRAETLSAALRYLGDLAGFGRPPATAALLAGVVYSPYTLATLGAAAVVTWTAPQSWDWSRRLTPARAALALLLLSTALVTLETQGYNPFIYFIF